MGKKDEINKYRKIAESDLRTAKTTAHFNTETGEVLFIIDEKKMLGPLNKYELQSLLHCGQDVVDMKDRITFLE